MPELTATPIVKNKFWIVERDGMKVATIQTTDDGIVWVDGNQREKYPTIKMLTNRHSVEFLKPTTKKKTAPLSGVNGFPVQGKFYNALYDLSRHLPIYTKEEKSKSFYCAGYYLIKINQTWTKAFCPKLITLQRQEYLGPFMNEEEQQAQWKKQNGK